MRTRGFDKQEKGLHINNLPDVTYPKGLIATGYYEIDHYGCWWECKDLSNNSHIWMIGDYPARNGW